MTEKRLWRQNTKNTNNYYNNIIRTLIPNIKKKKSNIKKSKQKSNKSFKVRKKEEQKLIRKKQKLILVKD